LAYAYADVLTLTANDQGHNATGTPLSTTQDVGIVITPEISIANGGSYEVTGASADTIAFAGNTGTLALDHPSSFTGEIAGSFAIGDTIDLAGFSATDTATTGAGSFNSATDETTLTVKDSGGSVVETFALAGDHSSSNWTVTSDSHGGIDIVDPPASEDSGGAITVITGSTEPVAHISGDPVIAMVDGTTFTIDAPSDRAVWFDSSTGGSTVVLDQPDSFTGRITAYSGTAIAGAQPDAIDLVGINHDSAHFSENYDASTGMLTVTDGDKTADFKFDTFNTTLDFASDGHGGTLVTDHLATGAAGVANEAGLTPATITDGADAGSSQSILSSLLKVFSADDDNGGLLSDPSSGSSGDSSFTTAPVNTAAHGPSSITAGASGANELGLSPNDDQAAASTAPTTTANEHGVAPAQATSPTLAAAFGFGSDSFSFHPNLGSDTAQNTGAPASELAHNNIQVSGPALASTTPEFHAEFALDVVHQDDSHLAATVDQFHQMAANSTLLH